MSRPLPYPNISPFKNKAVMDVNLNNYDLVFVKPIATKLDAIKPLYFIKEDSTEVEVAKIAVKDYSKTEYNATTKTLTIDLTQSAVGALSFTDLLGVPNRYPTASELETGHSELDAKSAPLLLVAKEDGIYFESQSTTAEIEPRRSRMRSLSKIDELEKRLLRLENKLK